MKHIRCTSQVKPHLLPAQAAGDAVGKPMKKLLRAIPINLPWHQ